MNIYNLWYNNTVKLKRGIKMEDNKNLKRHLKILSKQYSNIGQVAEEIINLQAILNLPKGTELFLSDIHGEYGSFSHILNK